ncbi:hypothetical protein [uncultured Victivallis sp.]|uniref:hypothetical protein n=1 Tax=uncultured Victivallis sp. TaxID=354118 RepID=UPI00259A131A|nr:hypothetical protein [uncultured Victivallis sp.]
MNLRTPKTLRVAGTLSRLRLQLPTDVDAPRGGSALRTGRSKALRFLERPRTPPGGTAASRPAFAGLTFRFAQFARWTATGKLPAAQTAFGVFFLYDFFM